MCVCRGDSFGRLYVIRLSDEEAAGVDAVAASAVVAGDDDDSYSRGDDSSDDTDRSKGRRRSSVNSRAIAVRVFRHTKKYVLNFKF